MPAHLRDGLRAGEDLPREAQQDINASFAQQLQDMKDRHLPSEEGAWDQANIRALRKTLQSHLSLPGLAYPDQIPSGYHQVSFNSLPAERELSHDGAEQRHAPNEDWKFRVWAGGYLEFQRPSLRAEGNHGPRLVAVNERITDARFAGKLDEKNAKAVITITRTLFQPSLDEVGAPVYGNRGELRILKAPDNILIKEEKILCFMQSIPPSLTQTSSTRRIPFPADPDYSQTMVPSPTLLFRFSALTRNAHAIHLDADYTRQVYGLQKPLVHGPLTSVLMLDVLGEALALRSTGPSHVLAVRSFQYRNLLPLFVNEPIKIACKRMHDIKPYGTKFRSATDQPWEKWDVWIQRGTGPEATLAVRGTAWISPVRSPDVNNETETAWDEVTSSNEPAIDLLNQKE